MIGYFETTPMELEEAAIIDGATSWQVFRLVALPIAKPGIVVSLILAVIFSWNNFVFGIVLASRETRTLPVAVYNMLSFEQVSWGPLAAAALRRDAAGAGADHVRATPDRCRADGRRRQGRLDSGIIEQDPHGLGLHSERPEDFGDVNVIHGVIVDIEDGEFVILVGPSGCGKSTLLRMIAGLEEISGGEIAIGSRVVNDLPAKDRDIAMVFQNYALYPHMTVADNMGFALKLKNAPKREKRKPRRAAAEILGLEKLLDRFPRQLSGGQRQRVAMGRAIVRDPQVFLFDEPLSNLDAKLRVQMRGEIKALHQRLGTTIVYVTHDQIEAMTMADKIVVMHDGLVEQIGTPLDLYDHPANLFVAGFIGSPAMNFIKGKVENGAFVTPDGIRLPLSSGLGSTAEATYGIRPEHIRIADGGIPVKVDVVEPTGSEIMVVGKIGGQEISCLFRDRLSIKPGDTIHVAIDPATSHLFDTASGARVGSRPLPN